MTNDELADKLYDAYSCLVTECGMNCMVCDYEFSKPSEILTTILDARAALMGLRWTPVTETLPPSDEWVLVTVQNMLGQTWVQRAEYSHSEEIWSNGEYGVSGVMVTAWMPLPEPWEGDEECKK